MDLHRMFVYGTLKKGEPNHFLLADESIGKAIYLGTAVTLKAYPLVIASKYNIPFLLCRQGEGNNIHGEVYDVDDKMLKRLDELEDHPRFYERVQEQVSFTEEVGNRNEGSAICWIYFLKSFNEELLSLPTMSDYSSYGSHGLQYVEACSRNSDYGVSSATKDEISYIVNQS